MDRSFVHRRLPPSTRCGRDGASDPRSRGFSFARGSTTPSMAHLVSSVPSEGVRGREPADPKRASQVSKPATNDAIRRPSDTWRRRERRGERDASVRSRRRTVPRYRWKRTHKRCLCATRTKPRGVPASLLLRPKSKGREASWDRKRTRTRPEERWDGHRTCLRNDMHHITAPGRSRISPYGRRWITSRNSLLARMHTL